MTTRRFLVHETAEELAAGVAARLVVRLSDVLATRDVAHVALTGGGIGTSSLRAVALEPAARGLDWSRVHLWWGDERFLPDGDAERNETQARDALITGLLEGLGGAVPALRRLCPDHVHAMPASDSPVGDDAPAAAGVYAEQLRIAASGPSSPRGVPVLDVVLLGVGPDGHVASLFPGHQALADVSSSVVPVTGSPKPPPVRLTLSLDTINAARAVWLLAAGSGKAQAVSDAVRLSGPAPLPAALVGGTAETLWLLDSEAAGALPSLVALRGA